MTRKRILNAMVLCLFVVVLLGCIVEQASAQGKAAGAAGVAAPGGGKNNDMMEKKGIEGLFKGKGGKDPRTPSSTKKWIGWGSMIVMVIVVKYL